MSTSTSSDTAAEDDRDYSDYKTPPLFSLPVLLIVAVVEVGWIWILWKAINRLADWLL